MAKKLKFQAPTGMHDVLPEDQRYFQKIYDVAENIVGFYDFQKIDTPILEETELFSKGTGISTDIVQKQMFTLKTKGGDYLTLRPEFTPGLVRAYIEHGMKTWPQPVRLYSTGPVFRHESPQSGRFRQFNQFNIEVLGEASSVVDAQVIQIFYNILKELKFKDLMVEINSIGDNQCRPYFKKLLVSYFKSRDASLCADCKRRLKENPLRILDCKEEKCQRVISQAPQTVDQLCDECKNHFKEVLEFLDEVDLPYRLNPHLVRGLDYYTKTVFEIFPAKENNSKEDGYAAKNALAGGGRYDVLIKLLGGEDTKATGGAMGIERVVAAMKEDEVTRLKEEKSCPVFLAQLGIMGKRKSLKLLEEFRKNKIPIAESFGRDSLKAQLKMADRLGAKYALLLGQREALEGTVIISDMDTGKQETVKIDKVIQEIKKRLKK